MRKWPIEGVAKSVSQREMSMKSENGWRGGENHLFRLSTQLAAGGNRQWRGKVMAANGGGSAENIYQPMAKAKISGESVAEISVRKRINV